MSKKTELEATRNITNRVEGKIKKGERFKTDRPQWFLLRNFAKVVKASESGKTETPDDDSGQD